MSFSDTKKSIGIAVPMTVIVTAGNVNNITLLN